MQLAATLEKLCKQSISVRHVGNGRSAKIRRPDRPITRQAVARHAKHVLSPSAVPRTYAPGPAIPGQSLLERAEGLIADLITIAETAKATGQLVAAIAALREIRSNLELQGKLSGEISSQNINFYLMEITESRIQEFLDAAAKRGPQVGQFIRDQVNKRFGCAAPNISVHFVPAPKRNPDGTLLLEASSTAVKPFSPRMGYAKGCRQPWAMGKGLVPR